MEATTTADARNEVIANARLLFDGDISKASPPARARCASGVVAILSTTSEVEDADRQFIDSMATQLASGRAISEKQAAYVLGTLTSAASAPNGRTPIGVKYSDLLRKACSELAEDTIESEVEQIRFKLDTLWHKHKPANINAFDAIDGVKELRARYLDLTRPTASTAVVNESGPIVEDADYETLNEDIDEALKEDA